MLAEPKRARGRLPALPQGLEELPFGALWRELPPPPRDEAIDPGSFRDRMAGYRWLVESTGPPAVVGLAGERHPLWGYAAQLFWQHASGRLGDANAERIEPESWWGNMNATLSIVPLRAATRAGVVPRLPLAPWPAVDVGFERPLRLWERFFARLRLSRRPEELEPLRVAAWQAHLASVHEGLRRFAAQLRALPWPERRFALGWTRMVDFLGAAAVATDFEALRRWGAGTLPGRMLRPGDRPGAIADMSREVNRTTRAVSALGARPRWRLAFDRWAWRRAMRAPELRASAPDILMGSPGRARALRWRMARAIADPTLKPPRPYRVP